MGDGERSDAIPEAAKVDAVIAALLNGTTVRVTTATREFEGRVWEVGRSPYDDSVRARIADKEGRVHYFRVDKADASVFVAAAAPLLPGGGEAETCRRLRDALVSDDGGAILAELATLANDAIRSAQPDAERAPQEDRDPIAERGGPGWTIKADAGGNPMIWNAPPMYPHEEVDLIVKPEPRPQGDEVETVARALMSTGIGSWDEQPEHHRSHLLRQAETVLAALDVRSGADTVKLADVEQWLNKRADRYRGDEFATDDAIAVAFRVAARELRTEHAPGADRLAGGGMVKLDDVLVWLRSRPELPYPLNGAYKSVAHEIEAEFASGADRPEGGQR